MGDLSCFSVLISHKVAWSEKWIGKQRSGVFTFLGLSITKVDGLVVLDNHHVRCSLTSQKIISKRR